MLRWRIAILVAVALSGPSGSGSSTSTPSGTSAPAATAKLPQLAIVLNRTLDVTTRPIRRDLEDLGGEVSAPTRIELKTEIHDRPQ